MEDKLNKLELSMVRLETELKSMNNTFNKQMNNISNNLAALTDIEKKIVSHNERVRQVENDLNKLKSEQHELYDVVNEVKHINKRFDVQQRISIGIILLIIGLIIKKLFPIIASL